MATTEKKSVTFPALMLFIKFQLIFQHRHISQQEDIICKILKTRSTQRAQTSLAEADHYSHILPTVKMLSLGCERLPPPPPPKKKKKKKKKKRFWIITCTTIWVCYHYYGVFLLIYSSYNTQITTKI